MFKALKKSEKGFTLVEMMATLTIFSLAMGAVFQVFGTGNKLVASQVMQLDNRVNGRKIMTQMEKDVQSSATVSIAGDTTYQEVQLFNEANQKYKVYRWDKAPHTLTLYTYNPPGSATYTTKVLAKDVFTANFTNPTSVSEVNAAFTFGKLANPDNMNMQTRMSPRWNQGSGAPFINGINPTTIVTGANSYTLNVIGINTHFTNQSVVKLYKGGTLYASSKPNGYTSAVTASSGTQLSATVKRVDSSGNLLSTGLPIGVYDLYVFTDQGASIVEEVYKYEVINCTWDLTNGWTPLSSGWTVVTFPTISLYNNGNSSNKDIWYGPMGDVSNLDVTIVAKDTGTHAATNTSTVDAAIAMGITADANGQNSSYIGLGMNANYVFLYQMVRDVIGTMYILKDSNGVPVKISNGTATLRARVVGGVATYYLNGTPITFDGSFAVPRGKLGFAAEERAAVQLDVIHFDGWN